MPKKPWHHAKQSRHERGYGAAWDRTRKRVIARDGGLCQPCLRIGRPTPFDAVDHIKPKASGGTDDDDNLQCICDPCHAAKTAAEATQGRGGRAKPVIGADGWPV